MCRGFLAMARNSQSEPTIEVRITTSSDTLDLSQQNAFKITITLLLRHSRAIRFNPHSTTLFDGRLLYQNGLTFTNTATGDVLPRNSTEICYTSAFNKKSTDQYKTLKPGKPYQLHTSFAPIVLPDLHTQRQSLGDGEEPPKIYKWPEVAGMENGAEYEIGVREGDAIKGDPFVVVKRARFKVSRPDEHGELNFP